MSHVIMPFCGALVATVALLIAWTVEDPLQWVREEVDHETGESYGECQSRNSAMRYIIPIACLMLGCAVACGYFAYKTKDIADSRLGESSWIFYTFFVQLQVLLLGIPILVILDEASAEATYLGRTLR